VSGFHVANVNGAISIDIHVSYTENSEAEEVAAALAAANRQAFEELEIRLGPLPEVE
jgi:hypothetical protein